MCFCINVEEGIRAVKMSRGLGELYKSQLLGEEEGMLAIYFVDPPMCHSCT